jgi:hypothetical protein
MASRRKRLLEPDLPGGFDEDSARREASRLKVPALRAALAALDADASGVKADLVDRLVASQKAAAPPPPPVEPRRLPWVTYAPHDRIARALTQRLYLIEQEEEDSGRKYAVLGSTGNVYTVKVGPLVSCDCPDAAKGNVCKHQLFVMLKVLRAAESSKLIYQRALLSHELAELFAKGGAARPEAVASSSVVEAYAEATGKSRAPAEEEAAAAPLRNSDCPVCFEALGTEKCEVCVTCHNGIHAECFGMWVRTKGTAAVTCPLCRSAWPEAATSSGRLGAEGFVNLAREAGVSSYRPSYSGWPNRRFWDEY